MEQLTIAQIRSLVGTPSDLLFYTIDPGQEGIWEYDPSDNSSIDNTGTVLVTEGEARIKRIYEGSVHIKWFGIKGDGTDQTALLKSVIESGNYKDIYIDEGTYVVTPANPTISVKSNTNIRMHHNAIFQCAGSALDTYRIFLSQ